MGATYRVLRVWASMLVLNWYRTRTIGAPIPSGAPCVIVVNHTNGLCDGYYQLASTERPVRILAKFKLFEVPVLGWVVRHVGAIPVYRKKDGVDTRRNADSFRAIYDALAAGDVVAVFPEGESRRTPYLRELKTGAARMALGAEDAAEWRAGVHVVPIGLTYADPERIRSWAEVWIGEPFAVAEWRAAWEESPLVAGRALTERIGAAMRALTLQVPPGEDGGLEAHRLACAAEALLAPDGTPLAARRQRAFDALERLRELDPGSDAARRREALELARELERRRVTAEDVLDAGAARGRGLALEILVRGLAALATLPPVLALFGPPFAAGRAIAARAPVTPDKHVTISILVGFAGALLWVPLVIAGVAWLAPAPSLLPLAVLALLGLAAPAASVDNWRALRRAVGRARLAASPALRDRLGTSLAAFRSDLARELR